MDVFNHSDGGSETPKQPGFTKFSFTKKLPKTKLEDSGLRDDSTKNKTEEKDFVLHVDSVKGINSTKIKEIPKELVVPCPGNALKFDKIKNASSEGKNGPKTVHSEKELGLAAQELIQESKDWEQQREEEAQGNKTNDHLTVRMVEDDEQILFEKDVESRPETSTLAEYDSIPVEGFGMGMLRGMGFKKAEGIGGFKKAAIECIEPEIRPKGLGLGASRSNKDTTKSHGNAEEDLVLAKGAYVFIERGSRQDKDIDQYGTRYGQVDGLNEETARVVVKLALGGMTFSLSENILRVVPKSEYKEYSKVLNKDQYKKHAEKQKAREVEWEKHRSEREHKNKRDRSRSPLDSKYSSERDYTNGHIEHRGRKRTWLRPQLKVRIVDKQYKGGKYYKSKVIVEDVLNPQNCVCRTIDGEGSKVLENVDPSACETIIPKENGIVMIVGGKYNGQLGEILLRNKRAAIADVQLLIDKEVVKLDFDDVCEFTGDIEMYI